MLDKVSVRNIIRDHCRTLYDYGSSRESWVDVCVFFGIPIAVTAALIWFRYRLDADKVTTFITGLSILAGLLFNLLVLIFGLADKIDFDSVDARNRGLVKKLDERLKALKETYANTSFSILTALVAILLLSGSSLQIPVVGFVIDGLAVGASLAFVLSLLMILRRIQSLFNNEVKDKIAPEAPTAVIKKLTGT